VLFCVKLILNELLFYFKEFCVEAAQIKILHKIITFCEQNKYHPQHKGVIPCPHKGSLINPTIFLLFAIVKIIILLRRTSYGRILFCTLQG
jgi:hypothetical protein